MKKKIVVIGSSNTDMIVKTPTLPRPGETVLGGRFSQAAGGKGANQAVAAARAGGEVVFIGCVGRDQLGDQAIEGFKKDGIDVGYVTRSPEQPSGVALILVDDKGENCIAVAPGANSELTPAHIEQAKGVFASAGAALIQLEIPLETVEAAVNIAADARARVILNPAPACPLDGRILGKVDIITPNRSEAGLLTGVEISDEESLREAARALIDAGVKTVVITLGPEGAYISGPEHEGMAPGFRADPVDTTAAGDTFNGALALALVEGRPLFEAMRFAGAAAALSVGKMGAQPSIPFRRDIEEFLQGKGDG